MIEWFFFGLIVGLVSTFIGLLIIAQSAINKIQKSQVTPGAKDDPVISARVEEISGVYYIFNDSDNSFVAQGATAKELLAHMESRWPSIVVRVEKGDPEVISRFKCLIRTNGQ
jgi:hypothetical protein